MFYRLLEAFVLAAQAKGSKRRNVMLDAIKEKAVGHKRADIVIGMVLADMIAGRTIDLEAALVAADAADAASAVAPTKYKVQPADEAIAAPSNPDQALRDGKTVEGVRSVEAKALKEKADEAKADAAKAGAAKAGGVEAGGVEAGGVKAGGVKAGGVKAGGIKAGQVGDVAGNSPDDASAEAVPDAAARKAKATVDSPTTTTKEAVKPSTTRKRDVAGKDVSDPPVAETPKEGTEAKAGSSPAMSQSKRGAPARPPELNTVSPSDMQPPATEPSAIVPQAPQYTAPPEAPAVQYVTPPEAPAVQYMAPPEAPAVQYVAQPEAPAVHSLASSVDAVARLLQAFASGDFADLYLVWTEVLAKDGAQLRHALQGMDLATVPWSEVADGFPQSVLDDVVALLSPQAVATLAAWIDDEVLNEIADDADLEVPRPQRMQRMRVAAMIHLLQSRDAALDETIFAAVLAEAMADSQPATVARLMAAWTGEGLPASIAGAPTAPMTRSQARAARAAMEPVLAQLRQALQSGDDTALRPALKRLSPPQMMDALLTLSEGSVGQMDQPGRSVQMDQPGRSVQMNQPGQQGRSGHAIGQAATQAGADAAPPDSPANPLQQMVIAILRADAANDGHDRSRLREAIESHANVSGDPKRFMVQVLDDMVNERVVDLESIAARFARNSEQAGERTNVQPVPERVKLIETILPGRAMPMRTHHAGWIERALAAHPPSLRASLSALLHQADPSAISVESLPPDLVQKIVRLLAGAQADAMLRCAFDVAQTFMEAYPDSRHAEVSAMQWQYLFVHLFELRRGIDAAHLATGLSDYLLLRHARTPTDRMKQLVQRRFGVEVTGEKEAAPVATADRIAAADPVPQEGESIYIGNAGQVLAAPYMPRLFSMVGLLEGGRFKDAEAAERAVHLMQLVVTGKTDAPEYQLGLNKILCGVGSGTPIVREIEATAQEIEVVEALINGMIGHWSAIGKTSVAGLRETFLQRPGALFFKDDAWQLKVQAGPIDMLLDRLPWSFSIIKHPWMERSVHVTWR